MPHSVVQHISEMNCLSFTDPPSKPIIRPSTQSVFVGEPFTLWCDVEDLGFPVTEKYKWTIDDGEDKYAEYTTNNTLQQRPSKLGKQDIYCEARSKNFFSKVSNTAYVTIIGRLDEQSTDYCAKLHTYQLLSLL